MTLRKEKEINKQGRKKQLSKKILINVLKLFQAVSLLK